MRILPSWKNVLLALLASALLILAFPDFEYWFLAWFALVPLMWAIDRQKHCITASFLLGWLFGTLFFFGTCWWLAYAPIHYASFPPLLAYSLVMIACLGAGVFPGIFAVILSLLLRRFGSKAILAAPFVWVACEFARYWLTGNNWNAIGYSQAFCPGILDFSFADVAGIYSVGFSILIGNLLVAIIAFSSRKDFRLVPVNYEPTGRMRLVSIVIIFVILPMIPGTLREITRNPWRSDLPNFSNGYVIAIQPNIPMSGLDQSKLDSLRAEQIRLAESAVSDHFYDIVDFELRSYETNDLELKRYYEGLVREKLQKNSKLVILPESPMNFMYSNDREFQQFIGDFARRNNVSVLFNSSEPDKGTAKYFNSAVMVGPDGGEIGEYDKIYLLPFGEAVPGLFEGIVPGFVGNFAYGSKYDLLPLGDAKAGVMICFESHFGQLSREYVRNGADVIIEMTNDGYLGPTPVLRQHLANAVFRAVETNRPVLRVTNVGISAYIDERGQVLDPTQPYQEDTRVWSVSKSDGSQTFYVKYGDWFAWLCTVVTIGMLMFCFRRKPLPANPIG